MATGDGTNPRALAWLLIQRGRIALADHDPPTADDRNRTAADPIMAEIRRR